MKVKSLSRVQLLATSWTAAYQAPPSMGFSRSEYWSGVPLPSPTTGLAMEENKSGNQINLNSREDAVISQKKKKNLHSFAFL